MAPRIPAGPDASFACELLRATMPGRCCVARQSALIRAHGKSMPDGRMGVCTSGECDQGREILAAIGPSAKAQVTRSLVPSKRRRVRCVVFPTGRAP